MFTPELLTPSQEEPNQPGKIPEQPEEKVVVGTLPNGEKVEIALKPDEGEDPFSF